MKMNAEYCGRAWQGLVAGAQKHSPLQDLEFSVQWCNCRGRTGPADKSGYGYWYKNHSQLPTPEQPEGAQISDRVLERWGREHAERRASTLTLQQGACSDA